LRVVRRAQCPNSHLSYRFLPTSATPQEYPLLPSQGSQQLEDLHFCRRRSFIPLWTAIQYRENKMSVARLLKLTPDFIPLQEPSPRRFWRPSLLRTGCPGPLHFYFISHHDSSRSFVGRSYCRLVCLAFARHHWSFLLLASPSSSIVVDLCLLVAALVPAGREVESWVF
jgi:hypothetical protein